MMLYIVIGLILALLIVLLIVLLVKRKKAKQRAAMEAQGDAPVAGNDEISQLIRDADAKLGGGEAGGQGAPKVATLPVFLVLGDAGCAKTSVMLHSGLDPELIAGQAYQSGNVISTRTANLWFTRRTVFAEAGGKVLADTQKWKQLVSRLAPKTSVVGKGEQAPRAAIVCFDCENFTKPGVVELAATAARTFARAAGRNLPSLRREPAGVRAFHQEG